ncbi:MAG: hypothetical protein EP334_10675 [Gammaproteobacteria bacterium]|nr:MAG: hypothetical protein EP334_10675 [Gammaproteobacteria bacterium]
MNLEFVKQINEYVIESLLEATDEDILSNVGSPNYPTSEDITTASQLIQQAIQEDKRKRLEQKKAEFAAYNISKEITSKVLLRRPITNMIADIVAAMQNTNEIPEGVLVAFREQQEDASDEDIALIWQNLVELGLIDPNDNDQTP